MTVETDGPPEVHFYLQRAPAAGGHLSVACRVVETAWRRGRKVYVHTASPGEARQLDELLWTFRQDSFLPHGLSGEPGSDSLPVTIGSGEPPPDALDVVLNLSGEIPGFVDRSRRVAEVVAADEDARTAARARYRDYRERGFPLKTHDV